MRHEWKFPFHILFHPFDGFWDLKYENRGRMRVAMVILLLLVVATSLMKQFSGFLVNYYDPRYLNTLDDLMFTVLPFFLFCVANWSVTTLMEGEGKFREIVIATAYALLPMILINIPLTFISRFLTNEETAFYWMLNSFGALWFLWLLFVGNMTIHQYTVTKAVVTLLLTVAAMGIIVFLGALALVICMDMYWFVYDIYRELIFR
ncbi:MAG: hypothetical protein A9Z00_05830 [Thermobacillus sp. ZCTH02-B1]|uniref:Yip1 family protein n=1 Tax=Thermobacillus sp. ZCTH02-B1 TaxID=1858795 RepID=UPI000B574B62|nr:Yip1 family protein [Thermobacillus sp. ZCTH02-B1]OUM95891.1 MAG: hypothetical protein A9Z00_05830 [Thermobacillus sp. ZCTH02-B1]